MSDTQRPVLHLGTGMHVQHPKTLKQNTRSTLIRILKYQVVTEKRRGTGIEYTEQVYSYNPGARTWQDRNGNRI